MTHAHSKAPERNMDMRLRGNEGNIRNVRPRFAAHALGLLDELCRQYLPHDVGSDYTSCSVRKRGASNIPVDHVINYVTKLVWRVILHR